MTITTTPYSRFYTNTHATWPTVFNDEELNTIVKRYDELSLNEAVVGNQSVDHSYRKSKVHFEYVNNSNQWIFDRLIHLVTVANDNYFQFDLTGFECFQYTTYTEGEYYNYHVDTRYNTFSVDKDTALCRKLSVSILLNDTSEFDGGNFQLCIGNPDTPIELHLDRGSAVFFPSTMLHRVTPITKGLRKSLVVWALGPKFR